MKKILSIICCVLLFAAFAVPALAEEGGAKATVTIAVKGKLCVSAEKVDLSDKDGDGALTVNDALFCAHEKLYDGGAAAGYGSATTDWGLSITKLWGDESGNFGYYVNNASASSLADPVKDGDTVCAFVYSDATAFSDLYCWFDSEKGDDGATKLTLTAASFDAEWKPITMPVAGAVVTINGEKTEAVTDAEGKATITLDKPGDYLISAVSETQTLVPPVLKVSVAAPALNTTLIIIIVAAAVILICVIIAVAVSKKKKTDEK